MHTELYANSRSELRAMRYTLTYLRASSTRSNRLTSRRK